MELRSVVVLDIKLGSKLGTGLGRRRCTEVVLDIKVGTVQVDIKVDSKLGAVLDRRHLTEVVYSISTLVPNWEHNLIEDVVQ
jgi:hypothetical protein